MIPESASPFDSIDSAHEFMILLEESIADALREVETELDEARHSQMDRRMEALALAVYKMNQLSNHVHKGRRILKDLRTIRRLLENSPVALAATAGR
jgi:hypothetical protein